ncbi:hypothetical protein FKP32DRAFT_1071883 [Trametes sanguinea]|nr:hypothetical protein FKP32DRAFT_1071883 [Trametes sanguinea]
MSRRRSCSIRTPSRLRYRMSSPEGLSSTSHPSQPRSHLLARHAQSTSVGAECGATPAPAPLWHFVLILSAGDDSCTLNATEAFELLRDCLHSLAPQSKEKAYRCMPISLRCPEVGRAACSRRRYSPFHRATGES